LADRIRIARRNRSRTVDNLCRDEIHLSIQYILNCASQTAGSCHGGSATGVYEFILKESGFIPYETCMPYLACSDDSTNGFCPHLDTSCAPLNVCRTCDATGQCFAVEQFPNATLAEYGTYSYYTDGLARVVPKIQAEIYARGPVAAAVNADPLLTYKGGIVNDTSIWHMLVNHIVSIVGWGYDEATQTPYWICRNSWGTYWGEMSYFRIIMGHNALGIESEIAWATPATFTVANVPCDPEDAANCRAQSRDGTVSLSGMRSHWYVDPSRNPTALLESRRRMATVSTEW
jgi:cathepsin X